MHILQEGVDLNTSFRFKLAPNRSWGTYYWALQITYSMNVSQDESMLSCFLHFQMSQQESRLIRPENIFPTSSSIAHFCWVCVNCSFSFLFIADGSGTQCGLLLQGWHCLTSCTFRGDLLRTYVVTSGYLSYCCLSQLKEVWLFYPHLWHLQGIFSQWNTAHWIFSVLSGYSL